MGPKGIERSEVYGAHIDSSSTSSVSLQKAFYILDDHCVPCQELVFDLVRSEMELVTAEEEQEA